MPEPPAGNYKLNWLLPAGNINASMPDYAQFVRLQLKGLQGRSYMLPKEAFQQMHYGFPGFSIGWFWNEEEGHKVSFHTGNPGTFLSFVYIDAVKDRAYILLANMQSPGAEEAFRVIGDKIKGTWYP